MTTFDSLHDLDDMTREALVDLLYRMADDALIIGQRHAEWSGPVPNLGQDIPFPSNIENETQYARKYYDLLHELGEPDLEALTFGRGPRQWRCAALACLSDKQNWALCLLRGFLYETAESVRLTALSNSTLLPLAKLASVLRDEKQDHLVAIRAFVLKMGDAGEEVREKMQSALQYIYPYALGLFESTEADEVLAQAGISPREAQLRREWESAVAPVLGEAKLTLNEVVSPVCGGRFGRHPQALTELLDRMEHARGTSPTPAC